MCIHIYENKTRKVLQINTNTCILLVITLACHIVLLTLSPKYPGFPGILFVSPRGIPVFRESHKSFVFVEDWDLPSVYRK